MYFPEKITKIKKTDRVLEIGPGTSPHSRSDVLLEKKFDDDLEHAKQCGGTPIARSDPRTVFYDGDRFPFSDGEFDYVICSHVVEHVKDVNNFFSEMFRVGKSGYIEYPLIYYEYVFDIPEHLNVFMMRENVLIYAKKNELFSTRLKPAQELWYLALSAGYTDTVSQLAPILMQGFEWETRFNICQMESISEMFYDNLSVPERPPRPTLFERIVNRFARFAN